MPKTITITGPASCGKTTRARELYAEHEVAGDHVVMLDDGERVATTHQNRPDYQAAVRIVTAIRPGTLRVAVSYT